MNLCKSVRIEGAKLKKEVGNIQKCTKNISPSSSTQTANLIFDDMQHDNGSFTTSTMERQNCLIVSKYHYVRWTCYYIMWICYYVRWTCYYIMWTCY